MVQNLFKLKFQNYQNKPRSWLHQYLIYKVIGSYILVFFYSVSCHYVGKGKLISIVSILYILYTSLCVRPKIWHIFHTIYLLLILYLYLFFFHRTQLSILSVFSAKNNFDCATTIIFTFIPPTINILFCVPKQYFHINVLLYVNTLIYLVLFNMLGSTLTSEEITTLLPRYKLFSFNQMLFELKIIIVFSVQLLNFSYIKQQCLWKSIRNRGSSDKFSLLLLILLLQMYFNNNIYQTKMISTVLYMRDTTNTTNVVTFLSLQTTSFFKNQINLCT